MTALLEYADIDFSQLTDAEKYTLMTALGQSRSARAFDLYDKLTNVRPRPIQPTLPGID